MQDINGYERFIGLLPGCYSMGVSHPETFAAGANLVLNSAAAPLTGLTLYGWSKQDGTPSPAGQACGAVYRDGAVYREDRRAARRKPTRALFARKAAATPRRGQRPSFSPGARRASLLEKCSPLRRTSPAALFPRNALFPRSAPKA